MAEKKVKTVNVVATKRGFINKIIEPGQKFKYQLAEGDELPSWMEDLDAKPEVDLEEALDLDDELPEE